MRISGRGQLLRGAVVLATLPCVQLITPGAAHATVPGPVIFTSTASTVTTVVPAGVCSIQFEAWGGSGGSGYYSVSQAPLGGYGGFVKGVIELPAGASYEVSVGAAGANSASGSAGAGGVTGGTRTGGHGRAATNVGTSSGGGGGVTTVAVAGAGPFLVAAGGGGCASSTDPAMYTGGNGGSSGTDGQGYVVGSNSAGGKSGGSGGAGGTVGTGLTGSAGSNSTGGTGAVAAFVAGGGGGGGVPGGGGGGVSGGVAGAGGGGKNYAASFLTDVVNVSATGRGGGSVIATYIACPAVAVAPATLPGGTAAVPYSQQLSGTNGTAPYTFSQTGTLPPGLGLGAQTGVLAGTPTQAGTYNFTITATDSAGTPAMGSTSYSVVIAPPTIVLSPTSAPGATVNVPYSQALTASGGFAAYQYAVTSGALPAGLTLNASTGALTGTPTQPGAYNFTVTATDSTSATGNRAYSITVALPTIAVSPTTVPGATVGAAYSQSITASGGTWYQYAVTAGALPAGLALNASTGALTGAPAQAGTYDFTVTATDASTATGQRAYQLVVVPAPLVVDTATLPVATTGVAYSKTVDVSGGTIPYTWSITAGSLPAGISLNPATGALTGTPTAHGTYNFTVTATDAAQTPVQTAQALTLVVQPAPLVISTSTLPSVSAGTAYSQPVSASGGISPYTWSITAGSLPAGISLNAATGALTGTPAAHGTYNFTVTATDAAQTPVQTAQALTLLVQPGPLVISTSTLPGGTAGSAYNETLAVSGGVGPYAWTVTTGSLPSGVALSAAGTLSGTPAQPGTFPVTVQATDAASVTATQALTLTVVPGVLAVSTSSLAGGNVGTAYTGALAATGGVTPYAWSVTSGTLPAGITLSPGGALSGTPTTAGTSAVTVTVTDAASTTATQPLSLVVAAATAPPAPTTVQAAAGTSSLTVTWTAPSNQAGITGYTATASPGPSTCTTSTTTCVLGAVAGTTYTVTVVANTANGPSTPSAPSSPVTIAAPVPPAQVPATQLTLTTDGGDPTSTAPGSTIVVVGTGFAANSTVRVALYSDPVEIGSVTTDATGSFRLPVTVPSGVHGGNHSVVALGVAPDGTTRAMKLTVTVEGAGTLPVTGGNLAAFLLTALLLMGLGATLVRLGHGPVITSAGYRTADGLRRTRSQSTVRAQSA